MFLITIIASLLLLFVPLCQSVYLDIHVPLPQRGCLEYQALFANRLLRSSSTRPVSSTTQTGESSQTDDGASSSSSSEQVDLFNKHTPHITLYLANFDLEVNNNNNALQQQTYGSTNNHIELQQLLNETKVNEFKQTISSLNFTDILIGLQNCHLSFKSTANDDIFYNINGSYTMLPIELTPCLQILSTTLLHALQSHLHHPIQVPSWVANMDEPERSKAIYRTRQYGSPNVLQAYVPHVTVGYDPSISKSLTSQWRVDKMNEWNNLYKQERETCIDEVQGIALGMTSVGGTVLANSRMGYWNVGKHLLVTSSTQ